MPLWFSSAAMVLRLAPSVAQTVSRTGRGDGHARPHWRTTAACGAFPPLPARLSAAAPVGSPNVAPRLLAAASASFVRRAVVSRSCCATSDMMPTARSFATGISAAMKRTPLSGSVSRNAALRERQSQPCDGEGRAGQAGALQSLRELGWSERLPLARVGSTGWRSRPGAFDANALPHLRAPERRVLGREVPVGRAKEALQLYGIARR